MYTKDMVEEKSRAVDLFHKCAPLFIAMGDTVRQQLLVDIAENDELGVNVTTLTSKTKLSRPAISYHLKILRDSGLIRTEKTGTEVRYWLNLDDNFATISELVATLQALIAAKKKQHDE